MAMDHTICKLQILDDLVQHTRVMIGLGGGGGGSSDEIVVVVYCWRSSSYLVVSSVVPFLLLGVWCVVVCGDAAWNFQLFVATRCACDQCIVQVKVRACTMPSCTSKLVE